MESGPKIEVFIPRRVVFIGPFIGLFFSAFTIFFLVEILRLSTVNHIQKSLFAVIFIGVESLALDYLRALRKVIFYDSHVTVCYEVLFLKRVQTFKYSELIVDIRKNNTVVSFMKKSIWKRPISSYLNSVWDPDQVEKMEQILLEHKDEVTIRHFRL